MRIIYQVQSNKFLIGFNQWVYLPEEILQEFFVDAEIIQNKLGVHEILCTEDQWIKFTQARIEALKQAGSDPTPVERELDAFLVFAAQATTGTFYTLPGVRGAVA